MGLFVNKLKLTAASRSMHQFLPVVRGIFPEPPTNDAVEATTAFLYGRLAEDVFTRFTLIKKKNRAVLQK